MADDPRPILTAAQMREADRRCIEDIGIPGVVLMDNAGRAVWEAIDCGRIGIVCGKGNNGGDGFVAARYALNAGCDVQVVLLARHEDIQGDARIFLDAYCRLGGSVLYVPEPASARDAVAALVNRDVLVDAMLGTGLSGAARGAAAAAIAAWPSRYTVAVDIPSGLNVDTGEPCGAAIRAELTVTFQCLKQGFLNAASSAYTGQVMVADIGIPAACYRF